MKVFYCDHFVLPLPDGHRFPMEKYRLLREAVASLPGVRLEVPDAATDEALLRVHTATYLDAVVHGRLGREEVRRIGFPWSVELVERSRRSVGGTLAAARAALEEGFAVNLAGGTHHAFPGHGEGFCVFNDVAVAARAVQAGGAARRVAVLDLDVHQGNGTAAVFRNDESVLTLSVHGEGNYPFRKEESDLDVSLPDGTGDEGFLHAVDQCLGLLLQWDPDLILYLAGADPWEGDSLGRLSVSRAGMALRDRRVHAAASGAGVPLAVVMSGGYAPDPRDIAALHAATVREALAHWNAARPSATSTGPR
jgi:acetoin utilization deacetylase AcuC-like enzyme